MPFNMPVEFSSRTRAQNIQNLKREPLDVLVIGGGIVGAGLIRDLALNGNLRAGLVEKGDFANGTSSATSQLIHGGFRYLIKRDFALIKEARRERETLLRIAPNLVKSAPIAILNYKGDPYPLTGMSIAAQYYNHLSKADKAERARTIRDPAQIRDLVGPIETNSLKGCVVVWDSMVDDARLTLLTLKDAHQHGAVVANYIRFVEFVSQPSKANGTYTVRVEDALSGEQFEIVTHKIVSAAGPWTDRLWEKDPSYDGVPRLTTQKAKGHSPHLAPLEPGRLRYRDVYPRRKASERKTPHHLHAQLRRYAFCDWYHRIRSRRGSRWCAPLCRRGGLSAFGSRANFPEDSRQSCENRIRVCGRAPSHRPQGRRLCLPRTPNHREQKRGDVYLRRQVDHTPKDCRGGGRPHCRGSGASAFLQDRGTPTGRQRCEHELDGGTPN